MIIRNFLLALAVVAAATAILLGVRGQHRTDAPWELFSDMDRQPKVRYQTPSDFFSDGRGARPPVEGTEPLGFELPASSPGPGTAPHIEPNPRFRGATEYESSGQMGDRWGDGIPVPVDAALLARGHERFDIFCGVCHGRVGLGDGIPGEFGLLAVANLQDRRIREMADGQIFHTIAAGKNTMMAYGDKLAVGDRWAIVAYVRALQLGQGVKAAELPAALHKELGDATARR